MKSIELSSEFKALRALSTNIGSNPLLVQGAGGNTSLKSEDTLWIKASGTWLQNADDSQLFVPVALQPLLTALDRGDASAEKSIEFVRHDLNVNDLRPSIETTVHAVLPQRIVVHVHCVDTISLAIRSDAQRVLSQRLQGFHCLWVPYFRPGLPLSRYISTHLEPGTDVIVLGNHGLVVAADTVREADSLLQSVCHALRQSARAAQAADRASLELVSKDTDYVASECPHTHAIALDEPGLAVAKGGSLYPDHVIFLGAGSAVSETHQSLKTLIKESQQSNSSFTPSIIVPGSGVLMHKDANASQHAMARCLSDVCLRTPGDASINYLNDKHIDQLLNWEAETYRQSIAT